MTYRKIELVRGLWGAVALTAPRIVLARLGGDATDPASRAVMRILGGRQAAQAAMSGVAPSPPVLALGLWIDAAHAVSALGFAAIRPRYARPAVVDAVIATGWAGIGLHDLRRGGLGTDEAGRSRVARRVLRLVPGGHRLLGLANDSVTVRD